MQSLQVQCPIPVKALMSDHLREELLAVEYSAAAELEAQLAVLETISGAQNDVFERQRVLLARHSEVEARIARLNQTSEGEELVLRVIQGFVELRVGDHFLDRLGTEIWLEDGKVVAIATPQPRTDTPELQPMS